MLKTLQPWQRWALITALIHALFVLFIGLDSSIFDRHSFRQSQVAISAYWLLQGGHWLAYETPVLGYPWSIPLEFPFFQLLVAGISKISGFSVEVSARLLGFAFYLGALPLIWRLARQFQCTPQQVFLFSLFYLISPFYLFWGRTVMIESCAVFFSLAWLTSLILFFENPKQKTRWFLLAVLTGVIGALTKITTFFVFGFAGGIYVLYFLQQRQLLLNTSAVIPLLQSLIMVGVPLTAMLLYTDFADQIKRTHPLGSSLTSEALRTWNYGTLEQRLDISNWGTLLLRSLTKLLGAGGLVLLISAFFIKWHRRELFLIGLLLLCYLSAFLVFFNLHMHDYYQYANYLFVLVIFAWIMNKAQLQFSGNKARNIMVTVVLLALAQFYASDFPKMNRNDFLRVTDYVREQTEPAQTIIVFGFDWSSYVAYYSERKALTLPSWVDQAKTQLILDNPLAHLGGMPLGAIVINTDSVPAHQQDLIQNFLSSFPNLKEEKFEKYHVYTGIGNKPLLQANKRLLNDK